LALLPCAPAIETAGTAIAGPPCKRGEGVNIEQIRGLTNWYKTLRSRKVYAELEHGKLHRIVNVGTKYVYILGNSEHSCIEPWRIQRIKGLPDGDIICPPAPDPDPAIQACIRRLEKITKSLRLAQLKYSRTSNLIDAQFELAFALHAIKESLSKSIAACEAALTERGAHMGENKASCLVNETAQEELLDLTREFMDPSRDLSALTHAADETSRRI
jgi:hypothetical protein